MRHDKALLTLLALLVIPAGARAQLVTLREVGDRPAQDVRLPIGAADCSDNIELMFQATGFADANTLAVFYGSNCAVGANRTGGGGTDPTCFLVTSAPWLGAGVEIRFGAQDLDCNAEAQLDVDRNLFFMTLPAADDGSDVTGANLYALTPAIQLDSKPPSAPTNVRGSTGENSIRVSWSATNDELQQFIVYWAPTTAADCSTDLLVPGEPVDPNGLELRDDISPTSSSVNLTRPVAVGEKAAVAVVAVDLAGNESVVSELSCIEGVETTGWLDLHETQGGKTGDTCSVALMNHGHGWMFAVWAMLLVMLGLRAARRHS